ncbi:MAG: O-methyltransferase [Clostridiales bacterium]|jgi:predicted O-methyltransferase YrrM|nr:O-methyltransferase [Clostridiales bacterium]
MIVNNNVVEYINSLEGEMPKYLKDLEEGALKDKVPIIKKETQRFIRFLLTLNRPKRILEIGAAIGFSAIYMSEYMPEDCTITTIEKVEMRLEKARLNLSSCPKSDKITLLEGDALVILEELAGKEEGVYDFIFLDAAKAQYINFLPHILKLLSPRGILITDNVLQDGTIAGSRYAIRRRDRTIHTRMREYLYTITHMDELESVVIPIGDGVTLTTKK